MDGNAACRFRLLIIPKWRKDEGRACVGTLWRGQYFRGFIAALGQELLNQGASDRGIIAAETFDYDIIDKIYAPYDNLALLVSPPAGRLDGEKVIASIAEGVKANLSDADAAARLRAIFRDRAFRWRASRSRKRAMH